VINLCLNDVLALDICSNRLPFTSVHSHADAQNLSEAAFADRGGEMVPETACSLQNGAEAVSAGRATGCYGKCG